VDRPVTVHPDSSRALGRRGFFAALLAASGASALGRIPYGGTLRLKVPWPIAGIDPHALDDATAALFGPAVAEPLFALDGSGRPYPTLANAMPEVTPRGTKVSLRPLLNTARGTALDARDLLFSLARARKLGGLGLFASIAEPVADPKDGLSVFVPRADPLELATALSSPITALLPRSFSRLAPDATGAFVATPARGALLLQRNVKAARGPAFVVTIEVRQAADLADALRSFEAGDTDVGWLGAGYHRPRAGAVRFDAGVFGWAVLRTGRDAANWGSPGVAQRLLDAIPPSRLSHLGLYGLPAPSGSPGWGGPPAELLVVDDAPHLLEIGRALAAILSQPGHELTLAPRPRREIEQRRATGQYALAVDFVRSIGPPGRTTMLSLLTAADPALAKRAPRLGSFDARQIARTLPLGVVGELRIAGAHTAEIRGLQDFNLGSVWLKKS
jgi:peptide/nickel transport system substrate-binding protein